VNSAWVVVPVVSVVPGSVIVTVGVPGVRVIVAVIVPIVVVVVVPVSVWAMGVVPSVVCLSSRCKRSSTQNESE
jgi:hypothetical protein